MGKVVADITMSLDGFITGPDDVPGRGLGESGECLHNWVMGRPWRYNDEGRRFDPLSVDREVLTEAMGSTGAGIIGRRMFDITGGRSSSADYDREKIEYKFIDPNINVVDSGLVED